MSDKDSRPVAQDLMDNDSPGDGIMEDDLTEERQPTPAQKEAVAETLKMDP